LCLLGDQVEIKFVILIPEKHGHAAIAPLRNVMRMVWVNNAGGAGHFVRLRRIK
jgi:hypothetical protein